MYVTSLGIIRGPVRVTHPENADELIDVTPVPIVSDVIGITLSTELGIVDMALTIKLNDDPPNTLPAMDAIDGDLISTDTRLGHGLNA